MTYKTDNATATRAFAERLAMFLQAGDVLALVGDIGAGKTTFTQGLATGLGVTARVNSPTFTIIKEYEGRLPLYHMDWYRLTADEELGLEEYFAGTGVTVVEWPEMLAHQLPTERLTIAFTVLSETERELRLSADGDRYVALCEEVRDAYSRDGYV